MILKKKDFQKLVNFIKEFQSRLPCGESSAELRDSLNLSLLHMHKFYKRVRIRCQNGPSSLEGSLSLNGSLTGASSPISPFISPIDRFSWRWLNLDVEKLSASFGHGDKTNFIPEIFFAVKDGDMELIEKLVQKDEDSVNELDAIGRSTAMYAINGGSDYLHCLKFLISKEVDLNHQSNDGFTCLHIACYYGYKDFVDVLLQANVAIETQDADGRTPLHLAAAYCSPETLQKLIFKGADPFIKDSEGMTAAMWACHFDQIENLQLLLAVQERSNPSPEARFQYVDNLGRTILHWAVSRTTNTHCMKFLLNAETANLCDDEGKTVFLYAAEHGCTPACEEVLALCSDDLLEDTDNGGRTALHLAAIGGHGEIVDFLLSKGAIAERPDSQGASPVDLVTSRNLNYCSLVLKSYQRYREKLAEMQAKLVEPAPADRKRLRSEPLQDDVESRESALLDEDSKAWHGTVADIVDNKVGEVLKERSYSIDAENKSLKIDCQDIMGFEVEGDIEEVVEIDVSVGEANDRPMDGSRSATSNELERVSNEAVLTANNDGQAGSSVNGRQSSDGRKNGEPDHDANNGDIKGRIDGSLSSAKKGRPEVEPQRPTQFDEESYEFENVSLDMEGQKIVLVGLHEAEDGFEIDGVNDLEFEDTKENVSLDLELEKQVPQIAELPDVLRVDPSQDQDLFETSRLSPRIESVTGLMETNTMPANHSASANMSVSSLHSDSEEEETRPNAREKTSKLDVKVPLQRLDDKPTNQLEYRDIFAKVKPVSPHEDGPSRQRADEETLSRTSHSKRKDKRDSSKGKPSSPKGKQSQSPPGTSRIPLGPLEPMKPLQPIIPPLPASRATTQFPLASYDSAMPPSPRSPLERSSALPTPVDSPRSKVGQLHSPRGLESRDPNRLSHIPRPTSPSSRDRHFAATVGNPFPPRPPLGR